MFFLPQVQVTTHVLLCYVFINYHSGPLSINIIHVHVHCMLTAGVCRPQNRWLDKLCRDNGTRPADVWR